MNSNVSRNRRIVLGLVLAALAFGVIAVLVTAQSADAAESQDQPYGGCKEAWQAPRSQGAADCREQGWMVRKGYVVSPRHVLRYYNLPSCRHEDGSGQRETCGWNVVEGDGNGHGLVYLAITMDRRTEGRTMDRYVVLRQCSDGVCWDWRR